MWHDPRLIAALTQQIVITLADRLRASMPMLSWPEPCVKSKGGSAFLIRTPTRILGVTARHVVGGFATARDKDTDLKATLGGMSIDLLERVIALGDSVDIATFAIEEADLPMIGFSPLEDAWPPAAPIDNGVVLLAGWPGHERVVGVEQVTGGIYVGWGTARVTNSQITVCVDHDQGAVSPLPGVPLPAPGFEFGGISGGPLMTINVEGTRVWRLGGVIVEGKPDYDYIVAAHADVIRDDGTLRA